MQQHVFSFEKLIAWQDAKELTKIIYKEIADFPAEEKFGLTMQIRRSAMSVCANLAEGSTRSSKKDQAHFTSIAYGSLIELLNHLIIANELNYLISERFNKLRNIIEILSVKIANLKKAQISKI